MFTECSAEKIGFCPLYPGWLHSLAECAHWIETVSVSCINKIILCLQNHNTQGVFVVVLWQLHDKIWNCTAPVLTEYKTLIFSLTTTMYKIKVCRNYCDRKSSADVCCTRCISPFAFQMVLLLHFFQRLCCLRTLRTGPYASMYFTVIVGTRLYRIFDISPPHVLLDVCILSDRLWSQTLCVCVLCTCRTQHSVTFDNTKYSWDVAEKTGGKWKCLIYYK